VAPFAFLAAPVAALGEVLNVDPEDPVRGAPTSRINPSPDVQGRVESLLSRRSAVNSPFTFVGS
jgi:hypothetical protein